MQQNPIPYKLLSDDQKKEILNQMPVLKDSKYLQEYKFLQDSNGKWLIANIISAIYITNSKRRSN